MPKQHSQPQAPRPCLRPQRGCAPAVHLLAKACLPSFTCIACLYTTALAVVESPVITYLGTAFMQCEWWLSSSAKLLMAVIMLLQ